MKNNGRSWQKDWNENLKIGKSQKPISAFVLYVEISTRRKPMSTKSDLRDLISIEMQPSFFNFRWIFLSSHDSTRQLASRSRFYLLNECPNYITKWNHFSLLHETSISFHAWTPVAFAHLCQGFGLCNLSSHVILTWSRHNAQPWYQDCILCRILWLR